MRVSNMPRTWLFMMRSRYRCRYLVSCGLEPSVSRQSPNPSIVDKYLLCFNFQVSLHQYGQYVTCDLRPVRATGSMCRHGDRTVSRVGKMDSSPFRLLPGKPSTPTMSPRFTLLCSSVNSSIDRPEFLRTTNRLILRARGL